MKTTLIPFDTFFCDNYPKATVPVDEFARWQGDMVTCLRSDIDYAGRLGLADHCVMRVGLIRKLAGKMGVRFSQLRDDLQAAIRDAVQVCRDSALVVKLGMDVPEGEWFTVDKEKSRRLQAERIAQQDNGFLEEDEVDVEAATLVGRMLQGTSR